MMERFTILWNLTEKMCVIAALAFVLSRVGWFRKVLVQDMKRGRKIGLMVIMGIISAFGFRLGIEIDGHFIGTQHIGAVVAGLIGGPLIGLGAGAISSFFGFFLLGGINILLLVPLVDGLVGGAAKAFIRGKGSMIGGLAGFGAGLLVFILYRVLIWMLLSLSPSFINVSSSITILRDNYLFLFKALINALGIATFMSILKSVIEEEDKIAAIYKERELASRAQLQALQAQINPHFLFNSLNAISSLIRTDAEKARSLLALLADFFRHTLKKEGSMVTLKEEMEFLDAYLAIEQTRLGDRLKVLKEIDSKTLSVRVPAFILQPLVENAIQHGISPIPQGGVVRISSQLSDSWVYFQIEDDGVGMGEGNVAGRGVGLSNVAERLQRIFGPVSRLDIHPLPEKGTKVSFRIPE
jgi:LytS/YehU family sensor histidine kinase